MGERLHARIRGNGKQSERQLYPDSSGRNGDHQEDLCVMKLVYLRQSIK